MGQTWEDLLFAHWRVDAARLQALIPAQIELDSFDGSAWIGVTPFVVTGMRARFMPPLPGIARFPEINVRTYVSFRGQAGILFFSLDTPNRAAVAAARRVYRLPYFRSAISIGHDGARLTYRCRRTDPCGLPAGLEAVYRPTGGPSTAAPGSFEWWATERYCLFTLDERQTVMRGDIHHPPWPLQPAEATFTDNTMAVQLGLALADDPILHFARRQDVVFWLNTPA